MKSSLPRIAIIGGSGTLGSALAKRLAAVGYRIVIGSRSVEKAAVTAAELSRGSAERLDADTYAGAAAAADLIILAVPYAAHPDALKAIREAAAGKIVVDTTVPLVPPKVMRVQLPPEDSAAVAAQKVLGASARVVQPFTTSLPITLRRISASIATSSFSESSERIARK
jgi:NADPH-dependent F420 reductase